MSLKYNTELLENKIVRSTDHDVSNSLANLAISKAAIGDYEYAVDLLSKSEQVSVSAKLLEERSKILIYFQKAVLTSNLANAEAYYEELCGYYIDGDFPLEAVFLISNYFIQKGMLEHAISFFKESFKVAVSELGPDQLPKMIAMADLYLVRF